MDSPKKRFLKTPMAKAVADITANPAVITALDVAILQLAWEQGTAKTPEAAAAIHWQLTGANRLRDTFLMIATPQEPLPKIRSDSLTEH
jgi:hypothetical protein